ncbi:MAG: phosphoribosylaminoimidazolesuccinocarboxamide synthase [Treponema sp.]|nr:phosphoribosylaminoimidazolesuccinocarboxamide synthase [Treponema sp.]
MELVKTGKTKDVYKQPDGFYLLKFKDTVTGRISGETDPGGNIVVGFMDKVAAGNVFITHYYFELLKKHNISTHYVNADLIKNEMVVRPAKLFGNGLEFIVRYKAAGSFVGRFGNLCKEGDKLPKIFEVTIKDDDRGDPPCTKEILEALKIITAAQYDEIREKTIKICDIIKEDIEKHELELIDIKLEFALIDDEITLIDEISPGNMRVCRNGKKLDYLTLFNLLKST